MYELKGVKKMKKLLCVLLACFLLMPSAFAAISIQDSPVNADSKLAADEFGAAFAYFSPYDDYIYYLKAEADKTSVIVFDAEKSEYKTIKTFTPDADYVSISVDADGNIYLLRQDQDETAKSGVIRLVKDGDEYTFTEYLFPAASGELVPVSLEFSAYSSTGAIRIWLNDAGDYIPALSMISVFWGSLSGHDELIAIEPGALTASVYSLEGFYDVYGYHTAEAEAFLDKLESGELLSPSNASLSPNGNMLLMTVPYQGETNVYVMDVYTCALELVYPPDHFSGSVYWNEMSELCAVSDDGETITLPLNGFSDSDWTGDAFGDWFSGEDGEWSDETSDWNDIEDAELGDWA